jgi:hypothetical protein
VEIIKTSFAVAGLILGVLLSSAAQAQKAALVRDVDRGTAQPVSAGCSGFSALTGITKCVLYTVPAGKRLVVELVSFEAAADSSNSVYKILFGKNNPPFGNILIGTNVFTLSPGVATVLSGTKLYFGAEALRFYLDESEQLAGQVDYTGGTNFQQQFSFSGFLVDK